MKRIIVQRIAFVGNHYWSYCCVKWPMSIPIWLNWWWNHIFGMDNDCFSLHLLNFFSFFDWLLVSFLPMRTNQVEIKFEIVWMVEVEVSEHLTRFNRKLFSMNRGFGVPFEENLNNYSIGLSFHVPSNTSIVLFNWQR